MTRPGFFACPRVVGACGGGAWLVPGARRLAFASPNRGSPVSNMCDEPCGEMTSLMAGRLRPSMRTLAARRAHGPFDSHINR